MKKGFTLVELLAVIVILGIVLMATIPIVSNLINDASQKAFNTNSELLSKAAESYYVENVGDLPTGVGKTTLVYLDTLVDGGFMNAIKNPDDESQYCIGYVLVTKTGLETFSYEPFLKCGNDFETANFYLNYLAEDITTYDLLNGTGDFETDSDSNGAADGWGCDCNASIYSLSTVEKYSGTYGQQCALGEGAAGNNVCVYTPAYFDAGAINPSHIYYAKGYYKKVDGTGRFGFNIHNVTKGILNTTYDISRTIGFWYGYSGIIDMSLNTNNKIDDQYRLYIYTNASGGLVADTYIDDALLLDLTDIYGAGYEPSKDIVDQIVGGI